MAFQFQALLGFFTLVCVLAPLVFTSDVGKPYPVSLVVHNSLTNQKNLTFTTDIAYRGILLGAMRRIQEANNGFKYTIIDDPNYGPFLESVNGVAGKESEHTYWEFLVKLQNGTVIRPDIGVGCYIPNPHDTVIFKFTTW